MDSVKSVELPHVSFWRVMAAGDWPFLVFLMIVSIPICYITWWYLPFEYLSEAASVRAHEQERSNGSLGHGDPTGPLRMEDFQDFRFFSKY